MGKLTARPVGIDLGTTFSAIAYLDERGRPRSVVNSRGHDVTPSAVWVKPDRSVIVGEAALNARRKRPDHVAVNFKRDMGEKLYHEPVCGKQFSPQALSGLVLKKLGMDARKVLDNVTGAVITVPAYFGDARRKATQDAGRIAGLNVLDIINEPTAAALAKAFREYVQHGGDMTRLDVARIATRAPSTTLIYDLGGGTFDVTIIRIDNNDFEVLATGGEVRLGGVDFDRRLMNYFCDEFQRRYGIDPRSTAESTVGILGACEQAKIQLSGADQTVIAAEYLGKQLKIPLSRPRFEQLTADLMARTQLCVEMLLEDALLGWDKIDDILLVGGSSRMPRVAAMLAEISGKQADMAEAPDQIVAHGAAIHAAIVAFDRAAGTAAAPAKPVTTDSHLSFLDPELEDDDDEPSPSASGSTAFDDIPISLPIEEEEDEREVPISEPIAAMAPQVATIAKSVRLTDVNSHGLGVIVRSSRESRTVNSVIVPKNTPLPTTRVKVFGTEAANQRQVRLRITEGDARDPRGCTQIGECVIKLLPKGLPKGAPVEVSFNYDRSGRVHVRAVEMTSGASAAVEIRRDSGFSADVVEKMADIVAEIDVQ
ncbi:MAG TPA: Hsp70 family protein [Phycisphaerae bacterium]|nr:Hsp70 family protein [Phycisphaerae bacterium]